MNKFLSIIIILNISIAQAQKFTHRDSLQGGMRFERSCFDVQHYELNILINPTEKSIVGYNEISFNVLQKTKKIQIDLFENMSIDSIIFQTNKLSYKRDNDAVFISFVDELTQNTTQKLRFYYSGKPLIAKNAPWDGGFVFKKDSNGNDFIGVAVQGIGASLWYPVKDSQTDEPDRGATIKVAVPNGLMNVSNGRFKGKEDLKNGYTRWDWEVVNPINTYSITVNIADYVNFKDQLDGLDLDFYVLRENIAKAKNHFEADVKPMLKCFQEKFGPYPFEADGYKLVETPYLGMEHQSAVAYGNRFKKGYLGSDLSGTGIGLSFDYITVHETAHEWFGNSITSKDIADMWIHEGFTTYSESVFLECTKGYEVAQKYINGQKKNIDNHKPIIGFYGVNKQGSSDMYYKGAAMLNTLRHITNNDYKWWAMLLKFTTIYKKQLVETKTVVDFFSREVGYNLTPFFNQYLKYASIPILVLEKHKKTFRYKWKTNELNFKIPIEIEINGKNKRIFPTNSFQTAKETVHSIADEIKVKTDKYYVKVKIN